MTGIKCCVFLAVALMGMACSREYCEPEMSVGDEVQQMTVKADICCNPSVTRTALKENGENYDVVWNEGDVILIGGEEFTLTSGAGSTCGEFSGPQLEDGEYDAYYATADGSIPTTQTYIAGRIGNAPMYARLAVSGGQPGPISFRNIGGLLRMRIKNIQKAPVRSIAVSVNGYMSSIRYVLDCGTDGVELSEDGTDFILAMPEDSYRGVCIEVSDGNTTVAKTLDASRALNISRSQITDAGFSVLFEGKGYRTYHMGHEYIDLGLPSGLMWATCNLGADSPLVGGGVYTWKEAVVDWGGDWRLPTVDEMNELLEKASWKNAFHPEYREVKGYVAMIHSKYIFFPYLSYESEYSYSMDGVGYYWSSSYEDYGGATPYAMALFKVEDGEPNHTFRTYPIFHYSVRPVLEIKK